MLYNPTVIHCEMENTTKNLNYSIMISYMLITYTFKPKKFYAIYKNK